MKSRIEAVMKGRSPANVTGAERVLARLARLYSPVVRLRAELYRRGIRPTRRLPCHVISVGNLTVGGTGKTPMTLFLAERLRETHRRVGLLSRGYGGGAEKTGGLVSDGDSILMKAEEAGDEPFLMATRLNGVPVSVGRDRHASGMELIKRFHPDVLVLDDGFQHLKLHRDLNIALLDTARPFGNTHVLPRGILREPPSALNRADVVVLTRADVASPEERRQALESVGRIVPECPVFMAVHAPVLRGVRRTQTSGGQLVPAAAIDLEGTVRGKRVFAFSGLASNMDFKRIVTDLPCDLADFAGFPDHHAYTAADIAAIGRRAAVSGVDLILTTEKDYVRFADRCDLPMELIVLGVDIRMEEGDRFRAFLESGLASRSRESSRERC